MRRWKTFLKDDNQLALITYLSEEAMYSFPEYEWKITLEEDAWVLRGRSSGSEWEGR